MKKVLAVCVLFLAPAAFASSSTLNPAGNTPQSINVTNTVTVTVPAVISIDVESDVTFDFSNAHYHTPLTSVDCTDAFPPGADCATATYTPSNVTIPVSGTANQIWLAVFSNKTGVQANMKVEAFGPATFSVDPGFAPQKIKLLKGTNSGLPGTSTSGTTTAQFLGTTGARTTLLNAFGSSVFGWTRIDQTPTLVIPGNTTFNAVTGSTANITFVFSY